MPSRLILFLFLFVQLCIISSWAQVRTSTEEQEVATAHDRPSNDPSRGFRLSLRKPIKQNSLLFSSVNSHLRNAITEPFHKLLQRFSPVEIQTLNEDPDSAKLLAIHRHRYDPRLEYGPTTVNSDHEYTEISDRAHGYCWGYATMVRYFTSLAFFDPSLPKNPNLKFYEEKIDSILGGEATIIPGYANLRELSLEPTLEFYLKLSAMELWHSRAARTSSFKIFRNAGKKMNYQEINSFIQNLETRLNRGELPKIMFSSLIPSEKILGMNADIHVVLATKVERLQNQRTRIYLWDNNFYTETLSREPKYLEFSLERGITYAPWYEPKKRYAENSDLVARMNFTPENDLENAQILNSLRQFCNSRSGARYCIPGASN
jgi:hypothetical protein